MNKSAALMAAMAVHSCVYCHDISADPVRLLPRKILAVYNKRETKAPSRAILESPMHRFAEMPLNHLGMELVYQEISQPFPSVASLKEYRGILSWLETLDSVPQPEHYCRWLNQALESGLKVVFLGSSGVLRPGRDGNFHMPAECRPVFEKLGCAFQSIAKTAPLFMNIPYKNSQVVEFERKLHLKEIDWLPFVSAMPGATSHLKLRTLESPPRTSEPIVTTAQGGVAWAPFVLYSNQNMSPPQFRWRLNPFIFFEQAFELKAWPRPDTTTANGRRIYYSHVDGDGFFNVSELDRESWSGEIFLKEILQKYPFSPFTVSLITGYYDMRRYNTQEALRLSREILNLPHVEPASHGYAHPLKWREKTLSLSLPGYRFNARKEILDSLEFINSRLLDSGRVARLFLWTGDCAPEEGHIGIATSRGISNLNGGVGDVNSRYDKFFNSYAFVAPLSRREKDSLQVYASNANENLYTNLWEGPYYGYRDVVETFEKTESPRRIKPVNVYIHFYSAEKIASLKALQGVYEWAFRQALFPMHAGDYAQWVEDFFKMRFFRLGNGHFRCLGGTRLRTLRFDGETRYPDLARSKGVIGFKHFQGSLYVFFSEAPEREIVLDSTLPASPYLMEANFEIRDWRPTPTGVHFIKAGWWRGELLLGGLTPGRLYHIRSGAFVSSRRSDSQGRLFVRFPESSPAKSPSAVEMEAAP